MSPAHICSKGAHPFAENRDSTVFWPHMSKLRKGSTNTARWIDFRHGRGAVHSWICSIQ
jgi:hypothetical protein